MQTETVLGGLLRDAEAELKRIRSERAELDRSERLAAERVAHLRALIELESGRGGDAKDAAPKGGATGATDAQPVHPRMALGSASEMRPEDIAAEVLAERGPLHYRELWDEVARRGGNILSGNPAAVLLTRISRDDRFAKAKDRGFYRLMVADEAKPTPKRRRRKARRRTRQKRETAAVPE